MIRSSKARKIVNSGNVCGTYASACEGKFECEQRIAICDYAVLTLLYAVPLRTTECGAFCKQMAVKWLRGIVRRSWGEIRKTTLLVTLFRKAQHNFVAIRRSAKKSERRERAIAGCRPPRQVFARQAPVKLTPAQGRYCSSEPSRLRGRRRFGWREHGPGTSSVRGW